ncbi:MAG: outer membrane lipoprotein carrier protein LolA [Thermodesulfobacteriota bacterium]
MEAKPIPRKRTALFLALLTALFCPGWAETWDAIQQSAGRLTSIQAEFIQEKHMAILARPLISRGRFYYQAPGSLRWEYEAPIRSILMVDNDRLKHYVQRKDKLVEDTGIQLQSMQIVLQEISGWLNGRFRDNPAFDPVLEPNRKITLIPKEKAFAAFIEKIELILSDKIGIIDAVLIYESSDSYTKLVFQNVVANDKIPAKVFRDIQ